MMERLTTREREVLHWVLAGKSDWEIASILDLSSKTINFHVQNAKRKLGTQSRLQAIVVAVRYGLVPFPSTLELPHWGGRCVAAE